MLAHAFNTSLGRQRRVDLCELEESLVYKVSSLTANFVTQRSFMLKNQKKKEKKGKEKTEQKLIMISNNIHVCASQHGCGQKTACRRQFCSHHVGWEGSNSGYPGLVAASTFTC